MCLCEVMFKLEFELKVDNLAGCFSLEVSVSGTSKSQMSIVLDLHLKFNLRFKKKNPSRTQELLFSGWGNLVVLGMKPGAPAFKAASSAL